MWWLHEYIHVKTHHIVHLFALVDIYGMSSIKPILKHKKNFGCKWYQHVHKQGRHICSNSWKLLVGRLGGKRKCICSTLCWVGFGSGAGLGGVLCIACGRTAPYAGSTRHVLDILDLYVELQLAVKLSPSNKTEHCESRKYHIKIPIWLLFW